MIYNYSILYNDFNDNNNNDWINNNNNRNYVSKRQKNRNEDYFYIILNIRHKKTIALWFKLFLFTKTF